MSKHHLKILIWAGLVAVVPLLFWGGLRGLGIVVSSVNEGANPESALHIVPNVPPDLQVKISWMPDAADTGREMEPFTRELVQSAYLRAWLQWNISYERGEPHGLKTYFAGPALEEVTESVERAAREGIRVEQSNMDHVLQLHMYSADGSIVSFTDTGATVAQIISDKGGAPIYSGETRATYDVVMLLQDGNWAVRHWKRTSVTTSASTRAAVDAPDGIATTDGTSILVDGQPFQIAGINYYPQATPWDLFWPNYDGALVEQDFQAIRAMGLNTVRVFIPFYQFGGPEVNEAYLEALDDLLTRADNQGLKVIVTLFDFRVEYALLAWPAGDRHLEQLIPRFKHHPAILAWDLKNEPDRDFGLGQSHVEAWLAHVARVVRGLDPNHLITVGWATAGAAPILANELDIVSFHYYLLASDLPGAFAAIRTAVPDRPIVLQEFGIPTWNSFVFPHGHTETEQASYYADILAVMRQTDSAGYLAWTLYDFTNVPPSVAGRFPWQIGPQKFLGVIRPDGTAKPAAALLAPGASLDVPREGPIQRFLKPFWLTAFILLNISMGCAFLVAYFGWRGLKRWRAQGGSDEKGTDG